MISSVLNVYWWLSEAGKRRMGRKGWGKVEKAAKPCLDGNSIGSVVQ